jgi:hypothetical protein
MDKNWRSKISIYLFLKFLNLTSVAVNCGIIFFTSTAVDSIFYEAYGS